MLDLCLVHVIWTERQMSKLVLNAKYFLLLYFFNYGWVLQFGAHSRYCKFLVICITFKSDFCVILKNQNKHSTLNSSINTLSKWHEPDINKFLFILISDIKHSWIRGFQHKSFAFLPENPCIRPKVCYKKQQIKVSDQLLVFGIGDLWRTWMIPNW